MNIKSLKSVFSPSQVTAYLEHIGFTKVPSEAGSFDATVENLHAITRLHLLRFPFENTAMHYTESHVMDVTAQGVFQRLVVDKRGYGSYCFGQNGLLLDVLRGLGYRAYAGPARVNHAPPGSTDISFTPSSHMVLFVQTPTSDEVYLVDVGFGGNGPGRPILLREGEVVPGAAPPEEHRLRRGQHPHSSLETTDKNAFDWWLEFRCGKYQPDWRVAYQFSTVEMFTEDRDTLNFVVSQRPGHGPFWAFVICISHFVVEEDGDKDHGSLGRLVLFGDKVEKRIGDRSEKVEVLSTDDERTRALGSLFNLHIPVEDTKHIQGRSAQLGGSAH